MKSSHNCGFGAFLQRGHLLDGDTVEVKEYERLLVEGQLVEQLVQAVDQAVVAFVGIVFEGNRVELDKHRGPFASSVELSDGVDGYAVDPRALRTAAAKVGEAHP